MLARSLALLLILSLALPAASLPVRVLSRTRADMDVQKRWNRLTVAGVLRDDRGAALPLAEVTMSISGWGDRTAITDAGGRFIFGLGAQQLEEIAQTLPSADTDVEIVVRYGGDSVRGPARTARSIDLSRETLHLQAVAAPPRLTAGETPRVLAVLRRGAEPAGDLPLTATIGEQSTRVYTGADGRAVFQGFEPPDPGRHRVTVSFDGSRRYNPAQTTRELMVILRTAVTLERTDDGVEPLSITVRGSLRGAEEPLEGTVTLVLDDTAYAYVDTDGSGRFEATVDLTAAATRFGPARARLRAVYSPAESWEVGSLSPALEVDVAAPPRVPLPVYWIPLLALAGALALAALIRSGHLGLFLEALRDRLRPIAFRRRRRGAAGRPVPLLEPVAAPPRRVERPRHEVAGWIWDAHLDLPVAGARIQVLDAAGAVMAASTSTAGGIFGTGALADGRYTVEVTRAGFVPERFSASVPHRGRLSRCKVRITPLRLLTRGAYESLAAEHDGRFGLDSPRQIQALLGGEGGDPEHAAALTLAFESLYFGGDSRVTRARHEQTIDLVKQVRGDPEEPAP